jgi:hypothetical protein
MVHVVLFSVIALGFMTRKTGKFSQAVPFIILFAFASIRYMFGNDYKVYYQNFYLAKLGGTIYHDLFFEYLNKFFPNFFLMIAFLSLLYIGVVYWMMRKNVPSQYMCVGLFVFVISPPLFLMNLSALRQCIAMLLFIIGAHFCTKKNYIAYIILILIASQFHSSAIILLPFVFLINDKPFNRKYFIAFCAILGLLLTWDGFVGAIVNVLKNFEDGKFLPYATQGLTNSVRATILSSFSMFYVLFNLPELKGNALVYSKLYLVSPTLAVLAIRISMLTRIQMYFDIFALVALPLILKHNVEKGRVVVDRKNIVGTVVEIAKRYVLPALIFIVYCLRYYSFFANPRWEAFTTYKTIFSII